MLRHSCMLSRFKGQPHFPSEVDEEMNIWRNHRNLMNIINGILFSPHLHNRICCSFVVLYLKRSTFFDLGEMDKSKYGHLQLLLSHQTKISISHKNVTKQSHHHKPGKSMKRCLEMERKMLTMQRPRKLMIVARWVEETPTRKTWSC